MTAADLFKHEKGDGGRTRVRTWDPLIKSQLLYQLSYASVPEHFPECDWEGRKNHTIRITSGAYSAPV